MSIADKLIQITENLKKIYDRGFQDGYNKGCKDAEGTDYGDDREYYNCPNCGSDFDIGFGEPQICPHCGTDLGEWWDGTPIYTCPNCYREFRTDGPPYCPSCGVNHDEWYEGMPSFTCPNCGETVYTEGPPDCPHCGTNADQWYEENGGQSYPEGACQNCGSETTSSDNYLANDNGDIEICADCGARKCPDCGTWFITEGPWVCDCGKELWLEGEN